MHLFTFYKYIVYYINIELFVHLFAYNLPSALECNTLEEEDVLFAAKSSASRTMCQIIGFQQIFVH